MSAENEATTATEAPAPRLRPAAPPVTAAPAAPAAAAAPMRMTVLGVFYPPNMIKHPTRKGFAGMPVVIFSEGKLLGVVVVSDPGQLGETLEANLTANGVKGPFQEKAAASCTPEVRKAAALAIANCPNPEIDRDAAIRSFGFSMAMLAPKPPKGHAKNTQKAPNALPHAQAPLQQARAATLRRAVKRQK